MLPKHLRRIGLAFLSTVLIANCSSEGGTGTEGTIDLTLNPTSGTAPQGGSVTSTGTLTRSGGFTGTVNFDVTGEPTGLTATVGNAVNNGTTTTATITVNVGSSVPAGPYALVVHATGSGVAEVTKTYNLTVTATGFSLSIAPAGAITLAQGGTDNSKTITITRVSFSPAVTLVAEGLPTGVTATFAGNPVTLNSSVMTLTATGSATLTTTPVTVTVRGTGAASLVTPGSDANLEATTSFTLNVIPAGNFTLTTTPATTTNVTQGQNGSVTVNLNRTGGNASSIALTSTGTLPAGMGLAFVPTSTTGNTAALNITTTGATPLGTTPIVIRGNTTGLGEQTVNLSIVVIAPSSTNASLNFSACPAELKPAWVAFQNGTGAWVVVTGVNDVYSFNVTAGKGGVTYVLLSGGGAASNVIVQYQSQTEWAAGPVTICVAANPSGRTLTGTVGGMAVNQQANVSFGDAFASVLAAAPGFTLNNAGLGIRDLVIYMHPALALGVADRMLVDRDENPAATFGTRNIQTDPFAFAAQPALITITGTVMGETFTHGNTFFSRATCDAAPLYFSMPVTGTQFTAYGAQTPLAGERHGIFISGSNNTFTSTRSVTEYVNTLTNHNVAMGSPMPVGTTTETGTNYSILRHEYTAPADLNSGHTWTYTQNTASKSATVTATPAYFGSSGIDMKIGEYTGLAGWIPTWAPTKDLAATGIASASGFVGTGGACGGFQRFTTGAVTVTF